MLIGNLVLTRASVGDDDSALYSDGFVTNMAVTVRKPIASRVRGFLLEITAVIFWIYTLVHILVYDLDRLLESTLPPSFALLVRLKLLLFLALLSTAFIIAGKSRTALSCLYIACYPVWLILVKIPYFIWKQKSWIVAFSFINSFVSFFSSLKRNVIITTCYGFSVTTILVSSNPSVLWLGMSLALATLAASFALKFFAVFTTTPVFKLYGSLVAFIRDKIESSFSLEEELKLPVTTLNQQQLEKWHQKLNSSVLQNRLYLFAARKLSDYQNSGMNMVEEIFGAVLLFVLTTIVFSVANLALFKIDPKSFLLSNEADLFHFFYYGFNNFFYSSIPETIPVSIGSQILSMAERATALLLLAVFASLLVAARSQKSSHDLNNLIKSLEQQSKARELAIERDYKVKNIREAIQILETMKAGTTKFLLLLSADLDDN